MREVYCCQKWIKIKIQNVRLVTLCTYLPSLFHGKINFLGAPCTRKMMAKNSYPINKMTISSHQNIICLGQHLIAFSDLKLLYLISLVTRMFGESGKSHYGDVPFINHSSTFESFEDCVVKVQEHIKGNIKRLTRMKI